MKLILTILFFIIPFTFIKSQEYPTNRMGFPTTSGINFYVEKQQDRIINEYEKFIQDTIYDIYMYTSDFNKEPDYDKLELGRYYLPSGVGHQIIIDNEEKFIGYELKTTPEYIKSTVIESNQFVKAIMIHELTHAYFYQNIMEMQMKDMTVDLEYHNFRIFPNQEKSFGASFIEEGVCEYITQKMGEIIPYQTMYIPRNIKQLINKNNLYNVKYKYASYFVKDFLDKMTLKYGRVKYGIQILLSNRPPTYEEILKPDLYFSRLNEKI